jgi:hypothetical protein
MSVHFNAPHWRWEGPDDEAEAQRLTGLSNFDAGTLATYAKMVRQMDLQVGRILKELDSAGIAKKHRRRLHERQRRRALFRYVAVHREEDRVARRRVADPGARALAGAHQAQKHDRAGRDVDGLGAHVPGGRGRAG